MILYILGLGSIWHLYDAALMFSYFFDRWLQSNLNCKLKHVDQCQAHYVKIMYFKYPWFTYGLASM